MPRAEVGTPKWLANKMKAKGLQKLRWWCQMCQKQCRDENGYKCHMMSEQHHRQMQVFAASPGRFMDDFSREFERSFMRLMATTYCKTRVLANTVYQDVISEKQHVHMNATSWTTLSEFVQYLERSGKCKIERADRGGWIIEYIDQEKLRREKEEGRQKKVELSEEDRAQRRIEEAVDEARRRGDFDRTAAAAAAEEEEDDNDAAAVTGAVAFALAAPTASSEAVAKPPAFKPAGRRLLGGSSTASGSVAGSSVGSLTSFASGSRKVSAMDKLMMANERSKRRQLEAPGSHARETQDAAGGGAAQTSLAAAEDDELIADDEPWVVEGLIVKILDPDVGGGKYFKKKAAVTATDADDPHVAVVKLLVGGDRLKCDEELLSTVVPAAGGFVRLVKGPQRARSGRVASVDAAQLTVDVQLQGGAQLAALPFDHVCKVA